MAGRTRAGHGMATVVCVKAKKSLFVIVCLVATTISFGSPEATSAVDTLPSRWEDCVGISDEFCVETLAHTPVGSTTEQVFVDAVPASTGGSSHPNMFVQISATGSQSVYGKALSALSFEIVDPTSQMLGQVTRTGIQPGSYRIVLRTGGYRPHSMTIKGVPVGEDPFKVIQGDDGNYTWEMAASAEAFVTLMDSTKWSACRSATVDPACEADTAFVKKLSGILVMVPPNYADTVVSPVSPGVDVSQGLWVASNSMVIDVMPELNLVSKYVRLPAYGPHFVPLDFPTAGLTPEGSRHLNPAYFEAFIPNALAAFMANFAVAEVATKLPAAVKATIESGSAGTGNAVNEIEKQHLLVITPRGGRVKVLLDHYSAPNPRVYVGSASTTSTTTSTLPTTTSPTVDSPSGSGEGSQVLVLRKGKAMTAAVIAKRVGMKVAKKSRLSISVATKRVCVVSKGRLLARRAGACRLKIAGTDPTGLAVDRSVVIKVR